MATNERGVSIQSETPRFFRPLQSYGCRIGNLDQPLYLVANGVKLNPAIAAILLEKEPVLYYILYEKDSGKDRGRRLYRKMPTAAKNFI
ncbi:MAG: hypothetical protein WAM73_03235 [Desulfobacterales bacterium]